MTLKEMLVRIGIDIDPLIKGGARVEQELQNIGSRMQAGGLALTAAVTAPILGIGAASIKLGMDAVEGENLFKESYKGMADQAREWSEKTSDALGLNAFELRRNSGLLFTMLGSMGNTTTAAFDMATGLTQLANDMASFYNLQGGVDEAFGKLRAGISGETEPLKQLGILVDENTIKHYALKAGLIAVGQEMTAAQKTQARYLAIMTQTRDAQGDLARTMDSPANRLRTLKAQFTETATELGIKLLPTFSKTLELGAQLASGVAWLVAKFAALPSPIQTTIVVLAGVAAAAGPVLFVVGGMASGFGALAGLLPVLAGATGIFSGVLASGLAPALWSVSVAASAVAAGFAGWHVGKWIGETTGLTDWIGKKLAGALYGVSEAEYEATRAAQTAAAAQTQQGVAVQGLDAKLKAQLDALKLNTGGLEINEEAQKKAKKAAEEHARALGDLTAKFTGADLVKEWNLWNEALRATGGMSKLTNTQLEEMDALLTKLLDKFDKVGTKASSNLLKAAIDARTALEHGGLMELLGRGTPIPSTRDLSDIPGLKPGELLNKGGGLIQAGLVSFSGPSKITGMKSGSSFLGGMGDLLRNNAGGVIQAALQGGGNVGASIGGMLGSGVADKLVTGITSKVASGAIAKGLGQVLTSAIPVVGPILGAVGGKLVGKLFGGLFGGGEKKKVQDGLAKFAEQFGGLDKLKTTAAAAGVSLDRLFNAKKVKDFEAAQRLVISGLEVYNQKMADAASLADAVAQRQDLLNDAVKRYGFEVSELPAALQHANLAEHAEQLLTDWKLLEGAGFDVKVMATRMKDSINEFIHNALRTGTEVPMAMKPMLEAMIQQGLLTDTNDDKITDLTKSGLTFGETLTEMFKGVLLKLDELIEKLTVAASPRTGSLTIVETVHRSVIDGGASSGGEVPAMGTGGVVRRATYALIGEKGPEAVIPLNRLGNILGDNGNEAVGAQVAALREELTRMMRRMPTDIVSAIMTHA